MENGDDKVKLHERLACVETMVEQIMTNHLPHIQDSVNKMKDKMWWVITLLVSNLVALILILVKFIFDK